MTKLTESQIEEFAIGLFRRLDYGYIYGPDIAPDGERPERGSFEEVILRGRLLKAVRRINSGASHTITATDNVLHFVTGASGSVILPTAASSTGRIITISNHSVAMTTSIAYRTAAATTTTAIAVNAEISIMSDGTEWFLTNN